MGMPAQPRPGLLGRPLSEVLGAIASQHELAGGGHPAAAIAAASAAALAAKAARGSRATWIEAGGAIAHAESLRMQAQALVEREAEEETSALMHDERSARRGVAAPAAEAPSAADRRRLVARAHDQAAELALAIAEVASEIAQLAADVERSCPSSLRPDALTAVALAEGAACAAARLVEINRRLAADDPRREAARAAADAARGARERTL